MKHPSEFQRGQNKRNWYLDAYTTIAICIAYTQLYECCERISISKAYISYLLGINTNVMHQLGAFATFLYCIASHTKFFILITIFQIFSIVIGVAYDVDAITSVPYSSSAISMLLNLSSLVTNSLLWQNSDKNMGHVQCHILSTENTKFV